MEKVISGETVAQHNSRESCWIIVHGNVYDVTDFLNDHPGGAKIILKYAGKDATEEYDPIHPPDAITTNLPKDKHLGKIDPSSVQQTVKVHTEEEKAREELFTRRPPLDEMLSLHDFEAIAKVVMPEKAWAYYSSAADDEITHRENHLAYHRIWFRPRVLRDVTNVDFSTSLLGTRTSMPFYITATALGKLGHPEGEKNLTRAAAKYDLIQMIPTLASCSFDEIVDAASSSQTQWLQLYVNKDRARTKTIVQHAEKRGIKGLFITVDAPQLGRREKDMRMKFDDAGSSVQSTGGDAVDRNQGAARAISSFIDPSLNWGDLPWFKSITKMPIILKGVQSWEDAVKAYDSGVAGIVLSNHGGRQLDFARSGIETLVEVVAKLKEHVPGIKFPNEKFQIFVDGGVRRASDVMKAVALGANGVGIGRPFLYAYSAYGQEGVERALEILRAEFEMNMRLIGARNIKELVPEMVDASNIHQHLVSVPADRLYDTNYESIHGARLREKVANKSKL